MARINGGWLYGIIILDVLLSPLSSALPAVASWHGLSRARTSTDVLLLEQQRPRRRAAPLRSGHTVGLREWRVEEEEERQILVALDAVEGSPWQSSHDRG